MITVHTMINTAFANGANDGALIQFALNEQITDHIHASQMVKEIIVEKSICDDYEKEQLTKLFRFVTTAPYGESLSRAKVNERGEFQHGH